MAEKMKRYITQALCILCAIALWIYVVYTEDPETQVWIRNIPLNFENTESIPEKSLAILSLSDTDTISIKVSGKRSALSKAMPQDFRASVDYSVISEAGTFTLPVSVTVLQNDLSITRLSDKTVKCLVDSYVTVEKSVSISASGAENRNIRDLTASPATVTLSGAKSVLESLEANVHIDLEDADITENYPVFLTAEDGKSYTGSDVTIGTETVEISATRSLPVEIETINLPENAEIDHVECDPETVDVRGTLPSLLSVDKIYGNYPVWADFSASPATSSVVPLAFPAGLSPLDKTSATANFYLR